MSATKALNSKKKRAARQNSNVFAIFDQKQISEFKEAFGIFDHNSDNIIDQNDLRDMLSSLGQNVSESYIDSMVNEAPGSINFTMFLTMMGEHLSGTDPEAEILAAFEAFDLDGNGLIYAKDLKDALMQMGDRFAANEVATMFKHAPITPEGHLKYREFVQMLKHGE
ncbi:EF-hand [Coemansia reversa NRRL 1564]|uniref:EF-hand n=1 Tax=Coemansia reversa (strain ATCC 12441 / NRRL 1564) TaxID=763665 RepID=A0A2G5BF28_COERN|nr:EF-hand [Coemansia reversa NRRL 1564]|eukprot:PIA17619.1 EF-hand [Coemansia reversa NRRL 1564]